MNSTNYKGSRMKDFNDICIENRIKEIEQNINELKELLVLSDDYGYCLRTDSYRWEKLKEHPLYKQILQDHEIVNRLNEVIEIIRKQKDLYYSQIQFLFALQNIRDGEKNG